MIESWQRSGSATYMRAQVQRPSNVEKQDWYSTVKFRPGTAQRHTSCTERCTQILTTYSTSGHQAAHAQSALPENKMKTTKVKRSVCYNTARDVGRHPRLHASSASRSYRRTAASTPPVPPRPEQLRTLEFHLPGDANGAGKRSRRGRATRV
jgi:hypothetical protein